ncbi:MAG: hypothetical protein HDS66_04810 [Bacteroidales bacterium]|nr:hypothetical protein [Bacteroidales bacterium]
MRTKNTSKEATVAQYIDEFLKGRSPQSCEEFRSRSIDRQYSSIIQWRRSKRIKESTPQSTAEIIDTLASVSRMIANAPEISDADRQSISDRLNSLHQQLDEYMERQRTRRIEELEQESRRISERLQELRGY